MPPEKRRGSNPLSCERMTARLDLTHKRTAIQYDPRFFSTNSPSSDSESAFAEQLRRGLVSFILSTSNHRIRRIGMSGENNPRPQSRFP